MPLQTPTHTPIQNFSDEQLMKAYAAGDVAAFDVLYARHEGAREASGLPDLNEEIEVSHGERPLSGVDPACTNGDGGWG